MCGVCALGGPSTYDTRCTASGKQKGGRKCARRRGPAQAGTAACVCGTPAHDMPVTWPALGRMCCSQAPEHRACSVCRAQARGEQECGVGALAHPASPAVRQGLRGRARFLRRPCPPNSTRGARLAASPPSGRPPDVQCCRARNAHVRKKGTPKASKAPCLSGPATWSRPAWPGAAPAHAGPRLHLATTRTRQTPETNTLMPAYCSHSSIPRAHARHTGPTYGPDNLS